MTAHRPASRDDDDGMPDPTGSVEAVLLVDHAPGPRRGRRRRAVLAAAAGLAAALLAVALLLRPVWGPAAPAVSTPPPAEPARPVALEVVPELVEPGGVVTAVLVASRVNDLTFGIAADVDRWDGHEWRRTGVAPLCLVEWGCVATVTEQLDGVNDIGLSAAPDAPGPATVLGTDGLADGWYRITLHAGRTGGVATGVFEVRPGGGTAPPHPAQDDVRLVVVPALVPPEGGVARVATQVPAGPDGTLTAEDVAEVDATLADSALVQRWDGGRWLDVADAPVRPPTGEPGTEWGTPVVLPALEEGSYRLVRHRADGPAPWGVFSVVDGAPALPTDVEPAPGTPPVEDVYAPDHPLCADQAGRCLLEAWWRDVVAEAGIERGGGDHDYGLLLSDSVRTADGASSLLLTLFPAEAAPPSTARLAVDATTQVAGSQVESGRWDDGADGRRVTCGGFVLQTWSTDVGADEIDDAVARITGALSPCPADVAALAARYPELPPVP